MRDVEAAHFANAAGPQAPARNNPPTPQHLSRQTSSIETYNSHRKIKRPKLIGDKKVYRPVRRHTLSRIDETPPQTVRPRSKSLQNSVDISSTRPILRSRSNISADTSRSVPVCNQSHDTVNQPENGSPQYAEPKDSDSSSYDLPASMTDLPIMVPYDPVARAYIPYPEYNFYNTGCRYNRPNPPKPNNLYLAFMY